MGYCTDYSLNVRKIQNKLQFNELVEYLKEKDLIGYAFDKGDYDDKHHEASFWPFDTVKWCKHAEDMVDIAEHFPNMYFELEGAGESFGDFWREYYHDMDIEYCRGEIIYEQPKKIQWTELIPF